MESAAGPFTPEKRSHGPRSLGWLHRKAACLLLALLLAAAGTLNPFCETRRAEALAPAVAGVAYAGYALCALLAIYGINTSEVDAEQVGNWFLDFADDFDAAMDGATEAVASFAAGAAAGGVEIITANFEVTQSDLQSFFEWCEEQGREFQISMDELSAVKDNGGLNSFYFILASFADWLITAEGASIGGSSTAYGSLVQTCMTSLGLDIYQYNMNSMRGEWVEVDDPDDGESIWYDKDGQVITTAAGASATVMKCVGDKLTINTYSPSALNSKPQLKTLFSPCWTDGGQGVALPVAVDEATGDLIVAYQTVKLLNYYGIDTSNLLSIYNKLVLSPFETTFKQMGSTYMYSSVLMAPYIRGQKVQINMNGGDLMGGNMMSTYRVKQSAYYSALQSGSLSLDAMAKYYPANSVPMQWNRLVNNSTSLHFATVPSDAQLTVRLGLLPLDYTSAPLTGFRKTSLVYSPYVGIFNLGYRASQTAQDNLTLSGSLYLESWGYGSYRVYPHLGLYALGQSYDTRGFTIAKADYTYGRVAERSNAMYAAPASKSKLEKYPDALDYPGSTAGAAAAASGAAMIASGASVAGENVTSRGRVALPPVAGVPSKSNPVSGSKTWGDALADVAAGVADGVFGRDIAGESDVVTSTTVDTDGETAKTEVVTDTIADTLDPATGTPTVITPVVPPVVTPDPIPFDVMGKFPFCLPNDFSKLVSLYSAEPEAPRFTWVFWSPKGNIEYEVSLEQFDSVASVLRTGMLISLMCGLVFVAVRFINMLRSAAK